MLICTSSHLFKYVHAIRNICFDIYFRFDAYIGVLETWNRLDYDRRCDKPWACLTNQDKVF